MENTNYIDYSQQIKDFYSNFNITLDITKIVDSYSITRYFIKLDRTNKTRITNVEKLVDDLAVELNIKNVKFSIDFKSGNIVFEIPKKNRTTLYFKDIEYKKDSSEEGLQVCFGKDLNNNNFIVDLCQMPHLLIAGTTGSGKSMFINSILINLLNNYDIKYLQISLIDPKKVELSIYKDVSQVKEIANNLQDTKSILTNALIEIDRRYKLLENNNCRTITSYNKKTNNKLAYKLIVIDELSDILLQDRKSKIRQNINNEISIEDLIVRIAQIGRACGVHLIVATQRPSSDVITGLIKANIPSRVAFSVSSKVDSRIILDTKGAEKLTGKGDMLLKMIGNEELYRLQGAYISDEEVESITNKLRVANIEEIQKRQKLLEQKRQEQIIQSKKEQQQIEYQKMQQEKKKKEEQRIIIFYNLMKLFFAIVNPITIIIFLFIWGYFKFALPILNN